MKFFSLFIRTFQIFVFEHFVMQNFLFFRRFAEAQGLKIQGGGFGLISLKFWVYDVWKTSKGLHITFRFSLHFYWKKLFLGFLFYPPLPISTPKVFISVRFTAEKFCLLPKNWNDKTNFFWKITETNDSRKNLLYSSRLK